MELFPARTPGPADSISQICVDHVRSVRKRSHDEATESSDGHRTWPKLAMSDAERATGVYVVYPTIL